MKHAPTDAASTTLEEPLEWNISTSNQWRRRGGDCGFKEQPGKDIPHPGQQRPARWTLAHPVMASSTSFG